MGKIVTFTGPTGAGKTTLVEKLVCAERRLIISYTTRQARPSDLALLFAQEYAYISVDEHRRRESAGDYLWTAKVGNDEYGTLRSSIEEALAAPYLSMMILVPERAETLYNHAPRGSVLPLFVVGPPDYDLRERLRRRGDPADKIESRIKHCKTWEEQARKSRVPFRWVYNTLEGDISPAIGQFRKYVKE